MVKKSCFFNSYNGNNSTQVKNIIRIFYYQVDSSNSVKTVQQDNYVLKLQPSWYSSTVLCNKIRFEFLIRVECVLI